MSERIQQQQPRQERQLETTGRTQEPLKFSFVVARDAYITSVRMQAVATAGMLARGDTQVLAKIPAKAYMHFTHKY